MSNPEDIQNDVDNLNNHVADAELEIMELKADVKAIKEVLMCVIAWDKDIHSVNLKMLFDKLNGQEEG